LLTLQMKISRHAASQHQAAAGAPLHVRLTPAAIVTMMATDDADAGGSAHE
jgi:hypothetical protein